jgi:hypothetical protein
MKKLSALFVTAAALAALVASTGAADAKGRDRGREYAKVDVGRVIARVEDQSGAFRKAVDRQLDHSRLNGTRREDRINAEVKQYDRNGRCAAVGVQSPRQLDGDARQRGTGAPSGRRRQSHHARRKPWRGVENEWGNLRRELNSLADVYNLKPLR